jgi:hypothetical protein
MNVPKCSLIDYPRYFSHSRVGIHKANFADFILDLRNCNAQLRLYIGLPPTNVDL